MIESILPRPILCHLVGLVFLCFSCAMDTAKESAAFQSAWSQSPNIDRVWAGADYWLNPLQAWRQKEGRLQVVSSGGDRNCVLLTRALNGEGTEFEMKVQVQSLEGDMEERTGANSDQSATDGNTRGKMNSEGWVGFQVGLKGQFKDYRDDAVHGRGFCAGITKEGGLFIGSEVEKVDPAFANSRFMELTLKASLKENETYELELQAQSGDKNIRVSTAVHPSWLKGLVALTCSQIMPDSIALRSARPAFGEVPVLGKKAGGNTFYAFSNWSLEGSKVSTFSDRAFGPILWAQYTLSDDVLKLSAQFAPIGNGNRKAELWIDGALMATESIDSDACNALFRIEKWDSGQDYQYEVRYKAESDLLHVYSGTIQRNTVSEALKVASLSCADDVGFPHHDLVENVLAHEPDLYVFHGDQLYERVGGYGVERKSRLDYLRKWYIFGWCFREFMRAHPVVIIPDDHDVFHGNLWGEGGKLADISLGYGYDSQDSGGYKESPTFVNMVHRTQTGHLPDPFDPTPVKNDISVYYTNLNYRGVSFAILGDRQWKSAPKLYLPEAEIENGWPQNQQWNAKTQAFHPDVELLGPRQEKFLEEWVADWSEDTYLKAVISQSPFCNVATLPAELYHDKYVPGLPRYRKGEYPENDRPVADFDSNGWPQNKRNKAIRTIRKAFALHFTGDQHLGSTGVYGVEEHNDAGFWISSPAVSNLWPRRWFPAAYGLDGAPENAPRYTGKYEDGFGNKITVKAIANPYDIDRKPDRIFDKAPGYSIINFQIGERKMELAAWPRWASPAQALANTPYEGWPITIKQEDNYSRQRAGYLEALSVDGTEVLKVYEAETDEFIYAIRPIAGSFKPFVFKTGNTYRVEKWKGKEIMERLEDLKVVQ